LRTAGLETVTVFEPFHYAARLPDDPDWTRRVDVLAPGDDPELSAIFEATPVERYGHRWRFFPFYLLAVAKFGALRESGDPRHAGDLFALYRRGIFDAGQARWAVARIWD